MATTEFGIKAYQLVVVVGSTGRARARRYHRARRGRVGPAGILALKEEVADQVHFIADVSEGPRSAACPVS